jgi:hypothetical protein
MKLLDEKGLTTVWAAIKNTFTSKSDADGKYAKKSNIVSDLTFDQRGSDLFLAVTYGDDVHVSVFVPTASSSSPGVMSNTDKAKLDGIASGANNYSLPTASATTLGGIKTGYNDTADASKWAVKVDNNGNAFVPISGLNHDSNNIVSNLVVGSHNIASYNAAAIVFDSQDHGEYSCRFPTKGGTFALTSDLSDLCKFNFINSINKCKSDRINFLFRYNESNIDLAPFDDYSDGIILLMSGSANSTTIRHSSGSWFCEGNEIGSTSIMHMYVEDIKLITKYGGKVHYYSL